jgi:hypothetical protein
VPGAIFDASETGANFGNCNPTIVPIGLALRRTPRSARFAALRSAIACRGSELTSTASAMISRTLRMNGPASFRCARNSPTPSRATRLNSRGYKGGGFNLDRNFDFTYLGGSPDLLVRRRKLVDAYELGLKTGWFGGICS